MFKNSNLSVRVIDTHRQVQTVVNLEITIEMIQFQFTNASVFDIKKKQTNFLHTLKSTDEFEWPKNEQFIKNYNININKTKDCFSMKMLIAEDIQRKGKRN